VSASRTEDFPDGATRTALVLTNKRARSGGEPLDPALKILKERGLTLLEPPTDERPFVDIIREHAGRVQLVILGGGDGTLNAAAPALVETKLPFGILPLGTANDLARTLGLPRELAGAAEIIARGERRALDLGDVNGHLFFNVASVGFSAALARDLTSEAKKRWGTLGYGLAAFRVLRQNRPFTAEIQHDGVTERIRTIQVSVGNGRFYGGGMAVEESAEPDDGVFDVYSLEVDHWWQLVALAPALRRGTHGSWSKVRAFKTTELSLVTRRRHDVNTDGEITTTTPATFRIRRKAVEVFAPPHAELAGGA
jgi:YegS/Rv2252/BmrU family lipid kinase